MMSEVARGSAGLVPPPDVLLLRPTWLRVLSRVATALWWVSGLLAASCAGMLIAEPVLARPLASVLVVIGIVAFMAALAAQLVTAQFTAEIVERDYEAREAAAYAAWLAEPHESVPVLEAVAEELAADAAEAAAAAAVRAAQVAAAFAQGAAATAATSPRPEEAQAAARRAIGAAEVAAYAVGHIPTARRPRESPGPGTSPAAGPSLGSAAGPSAGPAVGPEEPEN